MTTTSAPDDEKLGPIGPLPSAWESDTREIIIMAFRTATAAATAAAGRATEDLATSVHEFRKAIRRACAVLALIQPAISRDEYTAIRSELRTARRAVSAARDHTVASAALGELELGPEARAVADALLAVLREDGPDAAEISAQMTDGARRASMQADALNAVLPRELEWSTIAKGIARTYQEARDARKNAKRSMPAFHRWRRRAKEVDAQLTLVSNHGGERAKQLHKTYEEISNLLGPIADLLMLAEFIEAHGKAGDRARFEVLVTDLERLAASRIRAARKTAKPLFKPRPVQLAKKVTKAIRKDANPPVELDEAAPPASRDD